MKITFYKNILILLLLNGFFMLSCQVRPTGEGRSNEKESKTAEKPLSDEEVERMAGWNDEADKRAPGDRFGDAIERAAALPAVSPAGVKATLVNESYGDHSRNVFDFWRAKGDEPAPLIVFIHGGGFIRGDKSLLYESGQLDRLLEAGFAVAGVNYRFIHQVDEGVIASLYDVRYFIQYVRHHSDKLNIDKNRIGTYGGSAGGAASLWLAFSPDMAEPYSTDPILRESTRVSCVGAMATPATLDYFRMQEILNVSEFDRRSIEDMVELYGLDNKDEIYSEKCEEIRKKVDMLGLMSVGDPEFFVFNNEKGGIPTGKGHAGHHPNHAKYLKKRAAELNIPAVISAPEIGIFPEKEETLVEFFVRILK
jgi:pimeloyl-ACP methyl ester carboxylesterase